MSRNPLPANGVANASNNGNGNGEDDGSKSVSRSSLTPDATPPASSGRSKRQSAQVASMKNSMLYKPQAAVLAQSPAMNEKSPSLNVSQDIRTMLKFDGKSRNDGGVFEEPELSTPQPSYSGLPLESFPNAKIKKESLWPSRRKGVSNHTTPAPPEAESTEKEARYKKKLKTTESDKLTGESKIRTPPTTKQTGKSNNKGKKRKLNDSIILSTPMRKSDNGSNGTNGPMSGSPLRSSKRIKVTSPRKPITTANLAPQLIKDTSNEDQEDSSNNEYCSACGGSGMFICCEECPKSFHLVCCDPPLETIPEETWICRECQHKKKLKAGAVKQWDSVGIFGKLLNRMETLDPIEFQLPQGLKDNTFVNVNGDENGEYDDNTFKPELSLSKLNGNQIKGFNYTHDLELETLYDKFGNPYCCHKCGLSGLNNRVIVHCDYCPLVWHMDCLKDPLYTPKTLGTKWRCPNHYENLLPTNLFVKRNFKDMPILDISLHSHFLKIAHQQNVFIKYKDQPYLNQDGKLPTIQEYLQYEAESFNKFNPDYNRDRMVPKNTNTMDNRDDIHEEFKVPSFFNNYQIANAVIAKPAPQLKKIIAISELDRKEHDIKSFVYRIPEESIVLDFFTKVKKDKRRRKKKSVKAEVLNGLQEYEDKRVQELEEENEFVENMSLFHSVKPTVNDILEAALRTEESQVSVEEQKTSIKQTISDLTDTEITELQNIKRLLQLKGPEALKKFLSE